MNTVELIRQLNAGDTFGRTTNLPGLTLGTPGRRYLGAELMPTKLVPKNMFRDSSIIYRTVMANTGTRYSPVVIEKGAAVGSMLVELGEMDIGSTFTAEEYDAFVDLLNQNREMSAQAELVNWALRTLGAPIQERFEKQRWEAVDDALVIRNGANGYEEPVEYPNPEGHRVDGGSLDPADAANDPLEVLFTQANLLASKGYTVSRIVTSTRVISALLRHPAVREAVGGVVSGQPTVRVTRGALTDYLGTQGLPALEAYDLSARNRDGTVVRFKREDALTMFAETGRSATLDLPDNIQTFANIVGYVAVGRPAGMPTSGIRTLVEYHDKKPVGLYGESYATAGVVLTDPESVSVVSWTF